MDELDDDRADEEEESEVEEAHWGWGGTIRRTMMRGKMPGMTICSIHPERGSRSAQSRLHRSPPQSGCKQAV